MSWARAVAIATGFFFVSIILLGQVPSYIFTVSTLSTLARMEQGFLTLGLLSLGLGLLCFEISMLYDPKPLLPWPLFALAGAGLAAVGALTLGLVYNGTWHEFLPDATRVGQNTIVGWPNADQTYLFHPAWFQARSIDLVSLGMLGVLIGLGMLGFALLNPFVLSGRLAGPTRALLIRLSLGAAIVIPAAYLTVYTFAPAAVRNPADGSHGAVGNVVLFLALMAALFALQVWLLPIMVAHRQQFMPAVYLHGVIGLIGNLAVPFLVIWAALYPVVNLIHQADTQSFFVQCSQNTVVPGSCTFTPFTGYIICAIAFGLPFMLLAMGHYFWSTRRNTVVLGGTIALLWLGLAVTLLHVDNPAELGIGMILAIAIVVLAFGFVWSTQREFASTQAEQLGCTGQWLVLGTLMLLFLFGFALFSMPTFFEVEALALFFQPGPGGLHDAFWVLLLMGGLALFQMTLLVRRQPMSTLRKFAMWSMLTGIVLMLIGAIQGFKVDALANGFFNAFEGSHAVFFAGLCFAVVGIGAALLGVVQARGLLSAWGLIVGVPVLLGLALAAVIYSLPQPYPELVVAGFIFTTVGAFAYVAAGPDYEDTLEPAGANGANGYSAQRH